MNKYQQFSEKHPSFHRLLRRKIRETIASMRQLPRSLDKMETSIMLLKAKDPKEGTREFEALKVYESRLEKAKGISELKLAKLKKGLRGLLAVNERMKTREL